MRGSEASWGVGRERQAVGAPGGGGLGRGEETQLEPTVPGLLEALLLPALLRIEGTCA